MTRAAYQAGLWPVLPICVVDGCMVISQSISSLPRRRYSVWSTDQRKEFRGHVGTNDMFDADACGVLDGQVKTRVRGPSYFNLSRLMGHIYERASLEKIMQRVSSSEGGEWRLR
jgi:hypothetical protein